MTILIVTFILLAIAYIGLVFFTQVLETRYLATQLLLLGQSVLGLFITFFAVTGRLNLNWFVALLPAAWAVLTLLVFFARHVFLPQLQLRSPKFMTRQRVKVGLDHERITLQTEDNVALAGIHIRRPSREGQLRKVVLFSHGGFRSKNSFENLAFVQWLSFDFDVITFDTRGHFESGGFWTGDGKTVLDLKAAIRYATGEGYDRIGVFGRSLGGWSAMLYAAEYRDIDSMVIVAAPLTHIRTTPLVAQVQMLKNLPGRMLVRMIDGLRFHDYDESSVKPPAELLATIDAPTLMIYGRTDPVVGLNESQIREAFAQIPGKKELLVFPEEVHLPSSWHLGPIYLRARDWFLETL